MRSVKITLVYMTSATGSNRIPFAASFVFDKISFSWHLHKRRNQAVKDLLP